MYFKKCSFYRIPLVAKLFYNDVDKIFSALTVFWGCFFFRNNDNILHNNVVFPVFKGFFTLPTIKTTSFFFALYFLTNQNGTSMEMGLNKSLEINLIFKKINKSCFLIRNRCHLTVNILVKTTSFLIHSHIDRVIFMPDEHTFKCTLHKVVYIFV